MGFDPENQSISSLSQVSYFSLHIVSSDYFSSLRRIIVLSFGLILLPVDLRDSEMYDMNTMYRLGFYLILEFVVSEENFGNIKQSRYSHVMSVELVKIGISILTRPILSIMYPSFMIIGNFFFFFFLLLGKLVNLKFGMQVGDSSSGEISSVKQPLIKQNHHSPENYSVLAAIPP